MEYTSTAAGPVAVTLTSTLTTSTTTTTSRSSKSQLPSTPRSHRVARPSLGLISSPIIAASLSSPPLPARSPLRPPARSISSQSSAGTVVYPSNTSTLTLDSPQIPHDSEFEASTSSLAESALPSTFQMRERHSSFPSLDGLIDPLLSAPDDSPAPSAADLLSKSLPERPESPLSLNLEDEQMAASASPDNSTSSSSSAAASVSHQPTMTKRQHALHELLSSERAYASDLALIREVHIPLALGLTVPLSNMPISPPNSSSSSSRTLSTSSDSSTASLGPPMTSEDTKIIFSNITELALFADMFTEELEFALGSVVEGGQGEDSVGSLFLRIIPDLERPYKQYITRHPTALQHLQNLPQTPALQAYLSYTQTVASSLSHAWDLSSLLIKPVQRLLKYPLLLAAIIEETPDSHPDKENLRNARARMEEVARNVNEGRRRAEVVKDVLTSKTPKKPNATVSVAASVNLSKMKSIRHGGVTAATMRVSQLTEGNSEAAQVEAMQAELKRIDVFAQQFAKNVVDWGKMMSHVMIALRTWALSFGKVIGLSAEQGSEAFDAFVGVISKNLTPLTADLELAINDHLLRDMAHLLMTMNQPLKLLASMNEQEPYHYHLLTMPVSAKNRPPPSLLAASTNYLALRGQLAAELPVYLGLVHRGIAVLVRRLAEIQTRFWRDVKDRWADLWEMLRVEGELNVGWEETCAVWCARWADVDEVVRALGVVMPPVVVVHQQQQLRRAQTVQVQTRQLQEQEQYFADPLYYVPASPQMGPQQQQQQQSSPPQMRERDRERHEKHNSKQSSTKSAQVAAVQSMFAALEPVHSPPRKKPSATAIAAVNTLAALGPAVASAPALSSSSSTISHPYSAGYAPAPSSAAGSLFGGGGGAAAASEVYSVSAPQSLGATSMYGYGKEAKEGGRRGRGRGGSDASMMTSGWMGASASASSYSGSNGNGRRPSSQDSLRSRREEARNPSRRRTHGHPDLADEFADYMIGMPGGFPPPAYEGSGVQQQQRNGGSSSSSRPSIAKAKSMPLGRISSDKESMRMAGTTKTKTGSLSAALGLGAGGGYVVDGDNVYYQPPVEEVWEEYQPYRAQYQQQQEEATPQPQRAEVQRQDSTRQRGRDGARPSTARSQTTLVPVPIATPTTATTATGRGSSPPKRKSKERPSHERKRSGSIKSITSFFTGSNNNSNNSNSSGPPDPQPLSASQRDSWVSKPAKYICQVVHPCKPPASVSYYSFPFFTLQVDDLYEVLQEAGHPSIHPKLPLYVDDGEDCLLLCRDGNGVVGWALASFLEPLL